MSSPGQGPLAQQAASIQAANRDFQQKLTAAMQQASQNPAATLDQLNQCWPETNTLEENEMQFLGKMGDFGVQQIPGARNAWREIRLQILVGKAQILFILGRYEESQSALEQGRTFLSGAADPGASILDQLEIAVIQARS